jgi:hypothetical protein
VPVEPPMPMPGPMPVPGGSGAASPGTWSGG